MIFKITGLEIFKIAGLFHPDETSRWSTLVYSYHDKFASAGSVTGLTSYESEKMKKIETFFLQKRQILAVQSE